MDNRMITDQKETRSSIRYAGKAWRYIHDVTCTDAGNLNRKSGLGNPLRIDEKSGI